MNNIWYNSKRRMGKKIAVTYAYQPFRDSLNTEECAELDRILLELEVNGRLEAPYGEKVVGQARSMAYETAY